MWTMISLPLQMAERLRRVQPVSVANHVKARRSLQRDWLLGLAELDVNVPPFAVVAYQCLHDSIRRE